jgi:acyl carrier protein
MKQDISEIKSIIKDYIVQHFLQNKQIESITDTTPLMSNRLLDSISTIHLIKFLEEKFNIEFEAHEVDKDNFENVSIIAEFVNKKL